MVTLAKFKDIVLSFSETEEGKHHSEGITVFKVKKKVFATLNANENRCCVKFNEIDQSVFCSFDSTVIFPVPNKWGKQGWTLINLAKVKTEMLVDALTTAYCTVAPPKLAQQFLDNY